MAKVRVCCFAISLDGFGAGADQSLENPLGKRGETLHEWFFPTRVFRERVTGEQGVEPVIDTHVAARGVENVGAWILGRNMVGPVRGPWTDDSWRGWWGDNPPYHTPVFVLTHHPRAALEMEGGTEFYFVSDGI